MPGKPAPEPTSSSLRPCSRSPSCSAAATDRESRKSFATTSPGSVTAVRLTRLFHAANSSLYLRNCSTCAPSRGMDSAAAPSISLRIGRASPRHYL